MKEKLPPKTRMQADKKPFKKLHPAPIPIEEKSAEQLLEDLMDILSNRKEILTKLIKKLPRSHSSYKTFVQYQQQTRQFLAMLAEEQSAYGDGLSSPDPHNAYNDYWRAALQKWDTINHHRLLPFWRDLEKILKDIYERMMGHQPALPPTLQAILADQVSRLGIPGPAKKKTK